MRKTEKDNIMHSPLYWRMSTSGKLAKRDPFELYISTLLIQCKEKSI